MSGVIDLAIVKSPFASTRVFLTLEDLFWLGHDWQRILITDETDEQMIYWFLVDVLIGGIVGRVRTPARLSKAPIPQD
jgi:hypothetical protein